MPSWTQAQRLLSIGAAHFRRGSRYQENQVMDQSPTLDRPLQKFDKQRLTQVAPTSGLLSRDVNGTNSSCTYDTETKDASVGPVMSRPKVWLEHRKDLESVQREVGPCGFWTVRTRSNKACSWRTRTWNGWRVCRAEPAGAGGRARTTSK